LRCFELETEWMVESVTVFQKMCMVVATGLTKRELSQRKSETSAGRLRSAEKEGREEAEDRGRERKGEEEGVTGGEVRWARGAQGLCWSPGSGTGAHDGVTADAAAGAGVAAGTVAEEAWPSFCCLAL